MVNSVSFAARGVYDTPDLNAPQAYQIPRATNPTETPKKKHTVAKAILGTVVAAAVVATALALGHKYKGNLKNLINKSGVKDVKWLEWAKKPAKTVLQKLDKAGEAIGTKSKAVADKTVEYGKTAKDWVKGLFSKKSVATEAPATPAPDAPAA